jgi:hypothetical protein
MALVEALRFTKIRPNPVRPDPVHRAGLASFSGNVGGVQIGGIEREAYCSEELRIPAQ